MISSEEGGVSIGISKKRTKQTDAKKFEKDFEKLPKEDQLRIIEKFNKTTQQKQKVLPWNGNAKSFISGKDDETLMQLRFQLSEVLNQQVELRNQEKKLKILIRKFQRKQTASSIDSGDVYDVDQVMQRLFFSRKRKRLASHLDQTDRSIVCPLWNMSSQMEKDDVHDEKRIRSTDVELMWQEKLLTSITNESIDKEKLSEKKKLPPSSMLSQLIDQMNDDDEDNNSDNFEHFATNYFLTMPCLADERAFNAKKIFNDVKTLNPTVNMCEIGRVSNLSHEFSVIWKNQSLQWENKLFIANVFSVAILQMVLTKQQTSFSESLNSIQFLSEVLRDCLAHFLKASAVTFMESRRSDTQPVNQSLFPNHHFQEEKKMRFEPSFSVEKENYDSSQATNTADDIEINCSTNHRSSLQDCEKNLPDGKTRVVQDISQDYLYSGSCSRSILKENSESCPIIQPAFFTTTNDVSSSASVNAKTVESSSTIVSLNDLRSYLVKDHYLHQKIVAYIPLELNEVYQKLHEEGIYMPKNQLLKALDSLSIFVSTH